MQYYDPVKNWRRIKPHLPAARPVLERDFNKFLWGRWRARLTDSRPYPADHESCDWRFERVGRHPQFWRYVKHSACHWLVNHGLALAQLVEPDEEWRIVSTQKHSTVWDGGHILFDFNFLALQVPANEAFRLAGGPRRALPVGQECKCYYPTD
jgi:hypothetical protein